MSDTEGRMNAKRCEANIVRFSDMDSENLGNYCAEGMVGLLCKASELKPYFEELWRRFAGLKKGQTICGCQTRHRYCEMVLHRSMRSVQYLLYGRTKEPQHEQSAPEAALAPESAPFIRPKPSVNPTQPSDITANVTIFCSTLGDSLVVLTKSLGTKDSPSESDLHRLIMTLRKFSKDIGERADRLEQALEVEAA